MSGIFNNFNPVVNKLLLASTGKKEICLLLPLLLSHGHFYHILITVWVFFFFPVWLFWTEMKDKSKYSAKHQPQQCGKNRVLNQYTHTNIKPMYLCKEAKTVGFVGVKPSSLLLISFDHISEGFLLLFRFCFALIYLQPLLNVSVLVWVFFLFVKT